MMNAILKTCFAGIIGLSILISCNLFKPEQRAGSAGGLPKAYSLYANEPQPDQRWWKEFQVNELDRLIEEAFSGNFSIKEAWARLKQANAVTIQAGAERTPGLSGKAGVVQARQKSGSGRTSRGVEDYSIGLSSSYEVDFWGRVRSLQEAAIL
ncbi:MAG: TolC family protein, partial [Deltaproteobacteria bacterium]|nr:TolC family protein [Deltaproteobacteria bacterium]